MSRNCEYLEDEIWRSITYEGKDDDYNDWWQSVTDDVRNNKKLYNEIIIAASEVLRGQT